MIPETAGDKSKKLAVAPTKKVHGLGIGKGYDKSRPSPYYIWTTTNDGNRPKQYFTTIKEREKAFNDAVADKLEHGSIAAVQIEKNHRISLAEMIRLAEPTGHSILEIFERGLAQLQGGFSLKKVTVEQAAALFRTEQEKRWKDKKIGDDRWKEIRNMLAAYVERLGSKLLSVAATKSAVKLYVEGAPGGAQTRINRAKNLRHFFGWCVEEGMLWKNPIPKQEGVSRIPVIFSNEEVEKLFNIAGKCFPELVPILYLQWYAGIRPKATHLLDWSNVDFKRSRIIIPPSANKIKQPDIVEDLPLKVFALLRPLKKSAGPIAPANHIELNTYLHHKLGYGGEDPEAQEWPTDVARHTFASNLVPIYEPKLERVWAVLLHKTGDMLKRHYRNKNVTRKDAQIYFSPPQRTPRGHGGAK